MSAQALCVCVCASAGTGRGQCGTGYVPMSQTAEKRAKCQVVLGALGPIL